MINKEKLKTKWKITNNQKIIIQNMFFDKYFRNPINDLMKQ